jgi:hypothetical protein
MRIGTNVPFEDLDQFLWDQAEDDVECLFIHSGGMMLLHKGELPEDPE